MTFSEENYLKTIYHLTTFLETEISTNAIAEKMETKASSVTDMLKKLAEKNLVNYKKYQGVSLTENGRLAAKMIVRKHRLWEVFLVEKLDFSWDEVHDVAEQLVHVGIGLGDLGPARVEAERARLLAQVGVLATGHLVAIDIGGAGADVAEAAAVRPGVEAHQDHP